MNFKETIRQAAFLGVKQEAEDIVDYIMIRASLLFSVLTGAVLAIWIGRAVEPLVGALVGIGSYALTMRICALTLFGNRHQR